ncbi:MAG: class I SAM-dependent methyltransferase [Victivallales bacterium]|nr:class I SAM-dependent methyltransferase [Victivallales bacterium]
MKRKENASSQKLLGAYYTPKIIAETMVSWVREECFNNVLEPSCGDGVFLECMEMSGHWPVQGIDAIEIENEAAEKVERRFAAHDNCNVVNGDFFAFYHENGQRNTYSLIIGNPPYIRYQYLTAMQRGILSEILVTHGMKENKLINAWVAFMVACVQMLADNGTIAFVIPAEILQVAFAEELRLFLARHLTTITLVTFKKLVFPEIEQEVLLFIGEKRRDYEQTSIRIYELEDLDALHGFDINAQEFQPLGHVKEKWTRYFITSEEAGLLRDLSHDKRFCQFRDLGLINVGITTGDNNFFSVTEEIAERYELESVVLPLIGRSAHAHSIFFTSEDWQHNVKAGKKAQLVYFPDSVSYQDYPEKHKEYILLGEENKINEGYKCSIRDRWYIIPSVWVPDAFFLRRNNFIQSLY